MTYISESSFNIQSSDSDKINVVLVDDSKVALTIFERVLLSSGQVTIVGSASSATEALTLLDEVKADIILLDIEMPNRSGLDALPDILEKAGEAKVIIVSSFVDSSGPSAIKALSLGACDTLAKPGKSLVPGEFANQLIDKVLHLGSKTNPYDFRANPHNFRANPHNFRESAPLDNALAIAKPSAILIGASTGGISSIQEFLEYLSDDVSTPIFIAQHLPDAFINYFARQLGFMGSRKITAVYQEVTISQNMIYLAPGDGHMVINKTFSGHSASRIEHYPHSCYTPSVDALFESAAVAYDTAALAILMSGMGQDGCRGARNLFEKDSHIWAQDQSSSVVWGMPGSAVTDGTASAQLSPKQMALALNKVFAV